MSGFLNVLVALGRKVAGVLSGTIATSGTAGNLVGYSVTSGIGSVSASALSSGLTLRELTDNTLSNKFNMAISDPGIALTQTNAFTQVDVNGRVFDPAAATFFASIGTEAIWQWNNGGVAVTAAGRPFSVT